MINPKLRQFSDTQLLQFVLDILSKNDRKLTEEDKQELHDINVELAHRDSLRAGWRY